MKAIKKDYIYLFIFVFLVSSFLFLGIKSTKLRADTDDNIYGYAWSSNIGWISFNNCSDETNCYPGQSYGVGYEPTLDSNIFSLVGYAWSDSIGWIKFGGLSGFPIGPGTSQSNVTLNVSNEPSTMDASLTGWARACAGTVNGDCTGTTRTDGWDGWISFSGDGYGVKFNKNTGAILGQANSLENRFAWGSDVVGWIDFTFVEMDAPIETPTGSVDISGPTCVTGQEVPLTWTSSGMSSCSINGTSVSLNGEQYFLISANNITMPFSLVCTSTNNTSYSETHNVERKTICNPTSVDKKPKYLEI